MQTPNDLDEYRPIFRTIGAFLLVLAGRAVRKDEAYVMADEFLDQLQADLDKAAEQ